MYQNLLVRDKAVAIHIHISEKKKKDSNQFLQFPP